MDPQSQMYFQKVSLTAQNMLYISVFFKKSLSDKDITIQKKVSFLYTKR